jgi:DNA-binding transcriptional ArsR family regulator
MSGILAITAIDRTRNIDRVRFMDMDDAITRLSALATPSRLEVVRLLARAGPEGMPSGEIAKALKVAQNTLSTQLLLLSNARLVKPRRSGRSIIYRVELESLRDLAAFILADCAAGKIDLQKHSTPPRRETDGPPRSR